MTPASDRPLEPPAACRPEAYELFADSVGEIESCEGLLTAATAISMHELGDVEPERVSGRIDEIAERVRDRVRGDDPKATLAHAHLVLFEEEGLKGNDEDYYHPHNSYPPLILDTMRGIPISLTLIYKCVLDRLGLPVVGINAPGHFLAEVRCEPAPTLVDPFFGGQVLTRDEARARIAECD